jgi:hypothetical protein
VKVKDLILLLQARNPEAVVYLPHGETEGRELTSVSPDEEWTDTVRGRKYPAVVLDHRRR